MRHSIQTLALSIMMLSFVGIAAHSTNASSTGSFGGNTLDYQPSVSASASGPTITMPQNLRGAAPISDGRILERIALATLLMIAGYTIGTIVKQRSILVVRPSKKKSRK